MVQGRGDSLKRDRNVRLCQSMQSLPVINKVVSLIPACDEMITIQL